MANEAAVAEAPAAPIVAPVADQNYDVEDASEPIIAPAENAEVQPVLDGEKPAEDKPETKAEKILRLKELRKKDSEEFDEDAIEATIEEAKKLAQARAWDQHLYATDPDFKESYLKTIIKKGYAPNEEEAAFLKSREKPVEKVQDPNAKPRYSRKVVFDTIAAETAKMEAAAFEQGRQVSAAELMRYRDAMVERWITEPELEDAKNERAKEVSERTAREQKATADAKVQSDAMALREGAKAANKSYGDIWVKDAKLAIGFRCTNPEVEKIVRKLVDTGEDIKSATTMALAKLGKLQTGTAKAKASEARPVIQNQKVAQKAKVDPKYDIEE